MVKLDHDCDEDGRFCTVEMLAMDGAASVTSIDWEASLGSTFSGTLSNIKLE